jgi:hypothetical protein
MLFDIPFDLNSIQIENDVEAMLTCITTDIHQSLSSKLIMRSEGEGEVDDA